MAPDPRGIWTARLRGAHGVGDVRTSTRPDQRCPILVAVRHDRTAAFAQPAIARLELAGGADARQVHDEVYAAPAMITLLGGTALFAISTVLLARAAASAGASRWATVAFGVSGPLIGVIGIAIGTAQTVGAAAAIVGLARTFRDQRNSRRNRASESKVSERHISVEGSAHSAS